MMNIKTVDLFCGIGGLTHGLLKSGINVTAGVDIDSSCEYAYTSNNNAIFVHKDIESFSGDDLNRIFRNADIKILAGCAPCQPFSNYSSKYRQHGHPNDRWKLLYSFVRLIEASMPEIVSMENVPNLRYSEVFEDFVQTLKDLNYYVSSYIAYCPDYGIPQRRKRLVLLASRIARIELIPPTCSSEHYKTVRDAIGHLPAIAAGEVCTKDRLHRASALSAINLQRIRNSVPGSSWRDWDDTLIVPCHSKKSGTTFPSVYGRMEWDKPSPTITTQFYGYGNGRFGHPEQDRAISLREGAILQSFPDDYKFLSDNEPVRKRELGTHIGNAVPVELGRAIGISIKQHLLGE